MSMKKLIKQIEEVDAKLSKLESGEEMYAPGDQEIEAQKKALHTIFRNSLMLRKVNTLATKFRTYHSRLKQVKFITSLSLSKLSLSFLKVLMVLQAKEEYNPDRCEIPLKVSISHSFQI